jgi:hypothetical protein
VRGAVLEGCSAAGKTSVLKALKRLQAELDLERSVVIIAEHYSQALQKLGQERAWLSPEEHRLLLSERLEALEALQRWGERLHPVSDNAGGVFFVLERFHLNHRMTYQEDLDWSAGIEARLAHLGAMCCLLTVSESFVPERLAMRLRASGKPHDTAHVAQATRDFLKQQERFHEAAKRSALPTLILSTDDRDWNRCARAILDYR